VVIADESIGVSQLLGVRARDAPESAPTTTLYHSGNVIRRVWQTQDKAQLLRQ